MERRSRLKDRSPWEKGIGLAMLILAMGAMLLALPVLGVVDYERPTAEECVPGYSKCLDPGVSDYDCEGEGGGSEVVSGPIVVTGSDPFDLDPDGNGFGCE